MNKLEETLEMAILLRQGLNYRQIGERYGLAGKTVGSRLRKMSNSPVGHGTKASRVDKDRLLALYQVEKLPLDRIAAAVGVSLGTIQKLLKRYRLKRRPLPRGSKYTDLLQELRVGETRDLEFESSCTPDKLREKAKALGIKITVRQLAPFRCRVSRFALNQSRKAFEMSSIDPQVLRELYRVRQLEFDQIACRMTVPVYQIKQALKFYEIEKRPRIHGYGQFSDIFTDLEIGETRELKSRNNERPTGLYGIASSLGIRISIHKIDAARYQITRLT